MSRFSDYTDAASTGAIVPIWRHQLLDPEGGLLASNDPADITGTTLRWGASLRPLAVLGNRFSVRDAVLDVVAEDLTFIPTNQGSLLHPVSLNRVRISAGIRVSGENVYFVQATMLILDATAYLKAKRIEVRLIDPLRPVDSQLTEAVNVEVGETNEALVVRLLADLPSVTIASTGFTLPAGGFEVGTNRRELVNEILESAGHELTADPYGLVFSREIPPTTDTPGAGRWRYGTGGITIDDARRFYSVDRPQGFLVQSGDFQSGLPSLTKQIFDTDPTSEGFFQGPGECNCPTVSYAFALSNAQLAAAGYGQLRRHGVGPWMVSIDIVGNPAMRPNDLIDLEIPELDISGPGRVIEINGLPLQNEQLMTVTVRGAYDPAIGYDPPINNNNESGCLTTFSDLFNRDDENLEDLEQSPGNPLYSEIWPSWGIVGEQAVQRYGDGWSLGYVNTAFCFTDAAVTTRIGTIPAGRFVGPVVRSSSEMDGYVAMCDSNGRIRLEVWYANHKVAEIGDYQSGGALDGKDITVRAVGTVITVEINTATVITADDASRTGSFCGFLGYGGAPPQGPTIDQFSVAAA